MNDKSLPLTSTELKELANKVKAIMKTEFGDLRIDVWFMANDPSILYSFIKTTFDQVRLKILELETKN